MKTTFVAPFFAALVLLSLLTKPGVSQQVTKPAVTTATYKLTVVVPDVGVRNGKMHIGLANDQASFDGKSIQTKVVEVPAMGSITVIFDGLATGRYAVRMFQDLNDNGKIDFSGQMPTEPFGFSNLKRLMAPPTFDQASFELSGNKNMDVSLMSL
ncbi:DUF2141 domain-containing protein [Spirosoma luteum]|uniref:DUF2141 domain-containing protein n=1 Tax=Spirosoma luteum TaxID=431553 RepID=UPI00035CD6D1|nr:DUF2141 domain-containing protein [Spirosoma luteum]